MVDGVVEWPCRCLVVVWFGSAVSLPRVSVSPLVTGVNWFLLPLVPGPQPPYLGMALRGLTLGSLGTPVFMGDTEHKELVYDHFAVPYMLAM